MLNSLHIENIAVIERADISFDRGFNVLSGETGAGKSIVIDALNAALGERVTRDVVRTGAAGAVASALFSELPDDLIARLREKDCEPDEDGVLLLERRLSADGKAAARINGRPVTVAMLRDVGRSLVNIHGQHDNQTLLDPDTHVGYLDRVGALSEQLRQYREAYREYREVDRRLQSLDMDETQKARRMDLLEYQIREIEDADLQAGEEETIRARRDMFRNAERIIRSVETARQYLCGDDETDGAVSLLSQAALAMKDAGKMMDTATELSQRMQSLQYDLDAVADDVRSLEDELDFDESDRDAVETRYETLKRLFSKYGNSSEEVLAFLEECRKEYGSIVSADSEKARLTALRDAAFKRATEQAAILTAAREKAAGAFCEDVTAQLTFLDMPNVRFCVSIDGADLGENGADRVEFLLSANAGEIPKPLSKIASGGEMSRIMLALQTVLADVDDMETLVFDEIDVGVSGRAALKVGMKLHETATGRSGVRRRQVLCVTHLAQIAAQADHHLLVEKCVRDDRTYTEVGTLDEPGRERELARIIGGSVTESTLQTARELRREYGDHSGN